MSGTETILLVDNDDAVREIATIALQRFGYTVAARTAEEALEFFASGSEPDVLLTDVVMPGLSGPNLAARLLSHIPALRVLYMSGYGGEVAAAHGTGWTDVPLVQKPFTPSRLAQHVRGILNAPPPSSSSRRTR